MTALSIFNAARSSAAAEAFGGSIDYGAIDELGRPTGIRAVTTSDMTGDKIGSSEANWTIKTPSFDPDSVDQLSRGHLLGRQLGGNGRGVYHNLVTE